MGTNEIVSEVLGYVGLLLWSFQLAPQGNTITITPKSPLHCNSTNKTNTRRANRIQITKIH